MDPELKVKRRNESLALINAIQDCNVDLCAQLLNTYPSKRLNKLHRVRSRDGETCMFPFLLLAVSTGNCSIVDLFLQRKVLVDRMGYCERGSTTHTYTPLLKAIDQEDSALIGLLLEHGADPYIEVRGAKFTEEEGGACRYSSVVFPIEAVIKTRNMNIIDLVLRSCNPSQLYGSKKHTCLCFAALELCNAEMDPSTLNVLIQIMDLGARLCSGNPEDVGNVFRHSGCVYVNYLVHTALTEATANMFNFHLLQQVCRSDYVRESSTLYRALKKYSAYSVERLLSGMIRESRTSGALPEDMYNSTSEVFTWFIEYTRKPSSLKDICRIVIRTSCQPWRKEKGRKLPLPVDLQNFL